MDSRTTGSRAVAEAADPGHLNGVAVQDLNGWTTHQRLTWVARNGRFVVHEDRSSGLLI